MEVDIYDFLQKWGDTVRGMQPSVAGSVSAAPTSLSPPA